ncbi:hypothetical protein NMY3_02062 [Candidatus Nitrosocosmicus oleophilus]|jgi:hypothetical protein|uniref:Uncharacterized protein n=1 Tax=Candidatus Nitrosocosmicus oleophilus TaxID=1353260 RepID=A0A654M0Z3_9ARCH|nr:hypothetical protein NMY3_02062 [Candidatus Nitrosocosmicus oleophilus]
MLVGQNGGRFIDHPPIFLDLLIDMENVDDLNPIIQYRFQ